VEITETQLSRLITRESGPRGYRLYRSKTVRESVPYSRQAFFWSYAIYCEKIKLGFAPTVSVK
jgi:hypothetical protein